MSCATGLISFQLSHQQSPIHSSPALEILCGWRRLLRKLGVLGQRPDLYNGASFGNLSCRDALHPERFLITADETGHLGQIGSEALCEILKADLQQCRLQSRGLKPPSDQALSHQQLYQHYPEIGAICHFHLPELWRQPERLNLFSCAEQTLTQNLPALDNGLFLLHLSDHTDGFLCGAADLDRLGAAISTLLARYWALPQSSE